MFSGFQTDITVLDLREVQNNRAAQNTDNRNQA